MLAQPGFCGPVPVDRPQQFAVRVADLVAAPLALGRLEKVAMLGHHPGRLQDAQSLVVDRAGPWHGVPRRPAFDNRDLPTLLGQQQGSHQSDGPGADNHAVRGSLSETGLCWITALGSRRPTTWERTEPIPSISTSTLSPGCSNHAGVRA